MFLLQEADNGMLDYGRRQTGTFDLRYLPQEGGARHAPDRPGEDRLAYSRLNGAGHGLAATR